MKVKELREIAEERHRLSQESSKDALVHFEMIRDQAMQLWDKFPTLTPEQIQAMQGRDDYEELQRAKEELEKAEEDVIEAETPFIDCRREFDRLVSAVKEFSAIRRKQRETSHNEGAEVFLWREKNEWREDVLSLLIVRLQEGLD
jgi:hypothetical protein